MFKVATDALVAMEKAMKRDNIEVNDRQLACARINSPEGQEYLNGMAAAANFAWVSLNFSFTNCKTNVKFRAIYLDYKILLKQL